ncbi:hypothetical protein Prudu_162S000200 [Prunus dulcis]|uniref:Uncharacterized protein n=1 Tax=Prunus dulcis TaxID=3755 RepID=A0A5H2XKA6_PRUDU|nr:hypothetical protein Prudu_162S000200 [Prunus dulcis]
MLAPASSASSMEQPFSARQRHRPASTTDTTSTDASESQSGIDFLKLHQEEHRGPCRQLKTEVRSQLSDLDNESLAYVNRLFSERYKQWKSDLHHHFEAFDDPQVALQEGCPKELEGREDTKVNNGNRKKKTLLHHSGSRPFSYRMDARRQGGPNSQRSTSLATFMFDLGMNNDGGEEPVGSSGVRLPTSSRYSDRVCRSSTGCWVSDLDGDIGSDSRKKTGDILSRDGECQAEGTQTPFISALKQSGHCFDSTGGHSSESDVGDSTVPHTVRHSSPAF